MKNKKGFTLVELLAVIAILAVLVIIALPNVLKMFRNAKQNTFVTEVQNLVRSAEDKYLTSSLSSGNNTCFDSKTNPLDMSGRENINYLIKLTNKGKVIEVKVMDDSYQLLIDNQNGINKADIGNKYKVNVISEDTAIIGCDNTALKGEYVDKKLIIKKDNEEIKTIQMEKNTTTRIDKESGLSLITCNNGIEVSEENEQIKLDNVQVDNSVCNFSNDLNNIISNLDDTKNNILLIDDLILENQVIINTGKQVTIDMNGKSINSSFNDTAIINNSNLTIINSRNIEAIINSPSVIIYNKENATLNIENLKLISIGNETNPSAIYNNGKAIIKKSYIEGSFGLGGNNVQTAVFDVYESEILGKTQNGIQLDGFSSCGNIYNSTITGEKNAIRSFSKGIVNIYSGTFIGKTENGVINSSTGTINICSGDISGATYDLNNSSTGTINYTSKVTLKNGTKNGENINLTDGITCE